MSKPATAAKAASETPKARKILVATLRKDPDASRLLAKGSRRALASSSHDRRTPLPRSRGAARRRLLLRNPPHLAGRPRRAREDGGPAEGAARGRHLRGGLRARRGEGAARGGGPAARSAAGSEEAGLRAGGGREEGRGRCGAPRGDRQARVAAGRGSRRGRGSGRSRPRAGGAGGARRQGAGAAEGCGGPGARGGGGTSPAPGPAPGAGPRGCTAG